MKNVKCARCVRCGKEYEAIPNLTNCSCGGILDIVYDYDYIKAHFTKETLKTFFHIIVFIVCTKLCYLCKDTFLF